MCFNHYFGKAGVVEFLSATSTPSPASFRFGCSAEGITASTASASTDWCRSSATSSRSWRSCSCAVRSAVSFKPRKLMIFQVQSVLDCFFNKIYSLFFVFMTLFISILGLYMLCWWSFNTLSWYLQVCLCFFDLCCKYIYFVTFFAYPKKTWHQKRVCVCVPFVPIRPVFVASRIPYPPTKLLWYQHPRFLCRHPYPSPGHDETCKRLGKMIWRCKLVRKTLAIGYSYSWYRYIWYILILCIYIYIYWMGLRFSPRFVEFQSWTNRWRFRVCGLWQMLRQRP